MYFVVMRRDFSSVLSDDTGWLLYESYEKAQQTAINFSGIVMIRDEADRIITEIEEKGGEKDG